MSLFLLQLRFELTKLFARKRTYVGFIAFLGAEALIFALLHKPGVKKSLAALMQRGGYLFSDLYTGPTLAFIMLSYTVILLGSLYLALVGGDLMAKEVEDGTLRMMLCRPVSRLRILCLKYLACVVYTFALSLFIVGSSLLMSILCQGTGTLFVYAPLEGVFSVFPFGEGMLRFAGAAVALGLGMLTISTLGLALSCLNVKPATATIVTLSILFIDSIIRSIPYFKSVEPYCLSANIGQWVLLFDGFIPWSGFQPARFQILELMARPLHVLVLLLPFASARPIEKS
jgi:ABC-2 type transport system permease protein